jgi:cytochrome c oxidase subunit 2
VRRKTILVLGSVALAVVAAACAPNASQSALEPAGPYAQQSYDLLVPVFWVATAVFVLVEGLLLFFVIRYRHRKGRTETPPQVHGNTKLEIGWTILPTLILAVVSVPTVATIWDLAAEPEGDVLQVTVLAHQWWWEFDYPEQGIITANELHIPTDRPVYLTMCAVGLGYDQQIAPSDCQDQPAAIGDSVIHSFWVPELAGTQDVIPSRTTYLTIQADEPGTYEGQCKEFCGLSHAYMKFTVVAHDPAGFEEWVSGQQAPAVAPLEGDARAGSIVFYSTCTGCHAIAGLRDANGNLIVANGGPDLTHFASRECFAGCMLATTDENLRRWLENPPAVKAGSWMPDYGLTEQELDQLVAFLNTLD